MGKVEKVIVLSVLFLIALILVVSLTVEDPLNKSKVVEAGAPAKPTPPVVATAPVQTAAGGLLSTSVQTPAPTAPVAGANGPVATPNAAKVPTAPVGGVLQPVAAPALPAGAMLKSVDGLEDSILTDMKLYTWKEGDTYRGIANKYYGNWEKFTVLRRSNEGRMDVKPGDKIFVPIFDTEVAPAQPVVTTMQGAPGAATALPVAKKAADATAAKVAAKKSDANKKDTAKKDSAKKAVEPKTTDAKVVAAPGGKKTHLVKEGESLWKIAKDELGNGGRWKEIFELNKDVLSSPEAVHKGQHLRIP